MSKRDEAAKKTKISIQYSIFRYTDATLADDFIRKAVVSVTVQSAVVQSITNRGLIAGVQLTVSQLQSYYGNVLPRVHSLVHAHSLTCIYFIEHTSRVGLSQSAALFQLPFASPSPCPSSPFPFPLPPPSPSLPS